MSRVGAGRGARDERGQTTVLIIGFATVLALAVAVVVDVSAAYLRRQDLAVLADGAALAAADAGATGLETYTGGLGERAEVSASTARAGAQAYLVSSEALERYPGLRYEIRVSGTSVEVEVTSPLDLPFSVPGTSGTATVGATGSAVVQVER